MMADEKSVPRKDLGVGSSIVPIRMWFHVGVRGV